MKRIPKALAMLALFYVLPLIGAPGLILHYKILVLVLSAAAMLLTQPDFTVRESHEQQVTDKNSMPMILATGLMSQIVPVIEWGYFGTGANGYSNLIMTLIGLAMVIVGLAFRIWAIRTLGRFFTATVQIADGHRLVTTGPYSIVRHPSYLGAYVAIVGSAVFLNTVVGTICASFLMLFAYRKRLKAEEAALLEAFGEEYRHYQIRTRMIIPYVL